MQSLDQIKKSALHWCTTFLLIEIVRLQLLPYKALADNTENQQITLVLDLSICTIFYRLVKSQRPQTDGKEKKLLLLEVIAESNQGLRAEQNFNSVAY